MKRAMKIFHTVNCNLVRTNELECVENLNFPHIIIDLQSTSYDLDVECYIYCLLPVCYVRFAGVSLGQIGLCGLRGSLISFSAPACMI